jgi:hypothetical protein
MSIAVQVKRGVLANRPALVAGEFYYATDTAQLFVGPTPTLIGPSGGGSGAQGTTTINFGVFPGASDSSVVITGQAGIVAGSVVEAFLISTATSDHSADEHFVEPIVITAGKIVAGTGFTIYGTVRNFAGVNCPRAYGAWTVGWRWS